MDLPVFKLYFIFILNIYVLFSPGVRGTTFTFVNKCEVTVWPGILANAGSSKLDSTGFQLPPDSSRTFIAPAGWSGRFWGRTECTFSNSGTGSCKTGDCGSGQPECHGSGAAPPVTLAEFTLGTGGLDFYDVSLVDGFNLPVIVEAIGGSGMCAATGCVTDLNRVCPSELRVGNEEACRSACEAFGSPKYCCSGAFNSPAACKPTVYSQMFKSACPRSYSYAYDDPTSTFTCSGADYTVTFCPSTPSKKSSKDPTPTTSTTTTATENADDGSLSGSDKGSGISVTGLDPGSDPRSASESTSNDDGSWLAGLAMGVSSGVHSPSTLHSGAAIFIFISTFFVCLCHFMFF